MFPIIQSSVMNQRPDGKIFISYASEDSEVASQVCSFLEDHQISCWIAPRDILPGKDYAEAIIEGIDECRFMVLIFSSWANESPHILREVERAVNKKKCLIPFRIENVEPTKSLQYYIGVPHWLNAFPLATENYLDRLLSVIHEYQKAEEQNREPERIFTPTPGNMEKKTVPGTKRKIPAAAIFIPLVVIILAVVLIGYPLLAGIPPAGPDAAAALPEGNGGLQNTTSIPSPTTAPTSKTPVFPVYADQVIDMEVSGDYVYNRGNIISITGHNYATNKTYLYLTGTGSSEGIRLDNPNISVEQGNEESFTVAPVKEDNTWVYTWDTSTSGLPTDMYMIVASADPLPYSLRVFKGYDEQKILLKAPYIPPTLDPKHSGYSDSSSDSSDSGSGAGF